MSIKTSLAAEELIALEDKYGGLNYQIVFGDTIEFFFTVVKKNECDKLRQELSVYGDKKLCNFNNFKKI